MFPSVPNRPRHLHVVHDDATCRRKRARARIRAYHWGAFALGIACGTAVGMLLEALRVWP